MSRKYSILTLIFVLGLTACTVQHTAHIVSPTIKDDAKATTKNLSIERLSHKKHRFIDKTYTNIVKHGRKRARRLGFATANITVIDPTLKPGTYSCITSFGSKSYKSMCYYSGSPYNTMEVHIFGVNLDLYDKEISVTVKRLIRRSQKFVSMDDLKRRTTKDAVDCLEDLKKTSTNDTVDHPKTLALGG